MKIHIFGDTKNEKIILLHPMFSDGKEMYEMFVKSFGDYCIIAPDISNHGEDDTEYISAKDESEFLKSYLIENGYTDIKLVYGMSLGARIALELINEEKIKFSYIYMDGAPAYKNSKLSRLYYVPLYLGKFCSYNETIRYLKDIFNSLGLMPEKIVSYSHLSRNSLRNMIIDCSRYNFYYLNRERQKKMVFDYGSIEFDRRCIEEIKNNYPYSNFIIRNGYGHCQYARKKEKEFFTELKEIMKLGPVRKTDYKSWMPDRVTDGLMLGTAALSASSGVLSLSGRKKASKVTCAASILTALLALDAVRMKYEFDLDREDSLAREILETCADMVTVEPGAEILDIGCGSGAFGIAVKKKNPDSK